MSFTKLFSSITESTVWLTPASTRIVWITMLAMADRFGRVYGSVPGLAHRARVSVEECKEALRTFEEPDTESRTKEFEGRRILSFEGGWELLNHAKYRAIQNDEAIRESKRKYMQRIREEWKSSSTVENLPLVSVSSKEEKPKRARKHPMPDGWKPARSPATVKLESAVRDLDFEWGQFVDHHAKNASVFSDWDAAWRTWLRNSVKFAAKGKPVRREEDDAGYA